MPILYMKDGKLEKKFSYAKSLAVNEDGDYYLSLDGGWFSKKVKVIFCLRHAALLYDKNMSNSRSNRRAYTESDFKLASMINSSMAAFGTNPLGSLAQPSIPDDFGDSFSDKQSTILFSETIPYRDYTEYNGQYNSNGSGERYTQKKGRIFVAENELYFEKGSKVELLFELIK
ncbi:MAG: hypothetical protein VW378_04090 [bacterium]